MADQEHVPAEPGEVRPTGRRNARLGQTVTDMVRSLALVLGVIAVVIVISLRPQPDAVKVIDPTPALVQARIEADYPVLYPADLSSGWRPTSARWEVLPDSAPEPTWHVGFVTPDDAYAQIGQSATENPDFVEDQTSRGRLEPGDGEWQRYVANDTRSLVRVVGGVTSVVSGTAEWSVLQDLADRLSATALPTR